jgi:hypothetical protein
VTRYHEPHSEERWERSPVVVAYGNTEGPADLVHATRRRQKCTLPHHSIAPPASVPAETRGGPSSARPAFCPGIVGPARLTRETLATSSHLPTWCCMPQVSVKACVKAADLDARVSMSKALLAKPGKVRFVVGGLLDCQDPATRSLRVDEEERGGDETAPLPDEPMEKTDRTSPFHVTEAAMEGSSKGERGAVESNEGPPAPSWGVPPQGRGRRPSHVVTGRHRATPVLRARHTLRPAFGTSGMFRGEAREPAAPIPRWARRY